jgi:SPP1 family phage portal protein
MPEAFDSKVIAQLVLEDKCSKVGKYRARPYYYYKHKPTNTVIPMEIDGKLVEKVVSSNKLYINYFKMLVNQKIDYLMSKPITFTDTLDNTNFSPLQLQDILETGSLNASLDSCTWLHLFINEFKELDWIYVFDCEVFELKSIKYTQAVIRYYPEGDNTKVEVWDENTVTTFIFDGENIATATEPITQPHFILEQEYQGVVENAIGGSFGFIPFIPLYNNKAHESDIEDVESLVSVYNSTINGYSENIEEFQEALILLKGFSGDDNELKATMQKLKKYKGAGIPSDGSIEYLKVEIPVEARRVILRLIEDNIYSMGRGLNPNQTGDGNITNVVIKSRYMPLDNKANDTEKQLQLFYNRLQKSLSSYYGIQTKGIAVFNRSQVINESEKIESCVNSVGLISKETIVKNHPFVTDYKEELKQIEKESLKIEQDKVTE